MGLFLKKPDLDENRIESAGRWPVRLTSFVLVDEYEFQVTNFPEIYFVARGQFIHDSDFGRQALREGAVIVVNPGVAHRVVDPKEVELTRVRFLPEWLAPEYSILRDLPEVLMLFLDQSWFSYPRDEMLHVFHVKGSGDARLRRELEYLREAILEEPRREALLRISMLKLLALLAGEYTRFWRGVLEVEILPEVKHALDQIETAVVQGKEFNPARMSRGGYLKSEIDASFEKITGLTLQEYEARRRVFHAASTFLLTGLTPRRVAKQLGYTTTAELNAEFERIFEIRPSVYRKKFCLAENPDEDSEEEDA